MLGSSHCVLKIPKVPNLNLKPCYRFCLLDVGSFKLRWALFFIWMHNTINTNRFIPLMFYCGDGSFNVMLAAAPKIPGAIGINDAWTQKLLRVLPLLRQTFKKKKHIQFYLDITWDFCVLKLSLKWSKKTKSTLECLHTAHGLMKCSSATKQSPPVGIQYTSQSVLNTGLTCTNIELGMTHF